MNESIMESVRYYKSLGYSIIPVGKNKKPLVDWKRYQTVKATEAEIDDWLTRFPQMNIAIVTGKVSGIAVVDIDPKHGGKNDAFNRIVTLTSKTGGGGWHYYFQHEEGINNSVAILPGIDIRGEGGFVVAPPSESEKGKYEWIMSPQSGTPTISLPPFVKEWIDKAKPQNESNWDNSVLQGVKEGERNNSAASVAGKLMARFKESEWQTEAWPLHQAWNKTNCIPPLSDEELHSVFTSIAQRERLKPKDELVTIPVELIIPEKISLKEEGPNSGMLFHPALTIDINKQKIITSFPKMVADFEKEKFHLSEAIIVIESNGNHWELNSKEIKERKMYPQATPSFGYAESRWTPSVMLNLKNEANCDHGDCSDRKTMVIHPFNDLFLPIKERVNYFIDFSNDGNSILLTLWIIGTYLFPIFDAYPYIYLGGMRGSGKTKVLDILQQLVFNPESTSNSSTSSLFRTIERNLSTVLLDEGETLTGREVNPELRLLFNAGYKKSGVVTRTQAESFKTERFRVYSPKAIASINPLESTLASRCVTIIMLRTANQDKGKRRINEKSINWQEYRDNLYKFLMNHGLCVAHLYHSSSDTLSDLINRDNELFLPLFSIASYIDRFIDSPEQKILPILQKYAKESVSQEHEEGLDDWSYWVLEALDDIVTENRQYLIKDIKNQIVANRTSDNEFVDDRLTNKWIGGCLRKFGLKRGKHTREGKTYWLSRELIESLIKRYGVVFDGHDGHEDHEISN